MQTFGEMFITTYKDNSHWAKLANCQTFGIWVGYAENHPTGSFWIFYPKTKKIILTWDVIFLQKSNGEYTKVKKCAVLTMSYEQSDEEQEPKMVPVIINDNNMNVVSDSNSDSSEEDFENNEDNFFNEDIDDHIKVPPKPLSIEKWFEP